MDFIAIYAIAAGSILGTLFIVRAVSSLRNRTDIISVMVSKHLTYPYILDRHQLFGPWTRANVLLYLIYVVTNGFFVSYQARSAVGVSRRAGTLSVVNIAFLILATHLDFLADLLGISLQICRRIHRAIGYVTCGLLALHIIIALLVQHEKFSLDKQRNLFALIVWIT